jgi:glutathione S-transferase
MPAKLMRLLFTRYSPFSRKVLILVHERNLSHHIETVQTDVGTHVPLSTPTHDQLATANPLMKVPTLVTDEFGVLVDSRVICEYLDHLHGGERVFPADPALRWSALCQQALADGMTEAALLLRFEDARPAALNWSDWRVAQTRRIVQGLDALENMAGQFDGPLTIGQISIAATLGYLDFRFQQLNWRQKRPRLDSWFAAFAARRSMQATRPDA